MPNTLSSTLTNLLSGRGLRTTFTFAEGFRSRFGFRWWFLPIALAALAAVGWSANSVLERSMKEQKATELETLLSAEITALTVWLDSQKSFASVVAQDPIVHELVVRLGDVADRDPVLLTTDPAQKAISNYLRPLALARGYIDFVITSRRGLVLASAVPQAIGNPSLTRHAQFLAPALAGLVMVSRPFRAEIPLPDEGGEAVWGRPTMFVAAPVRDTDGEVIAALGLRIRPEVDFTRILNVARPGESGETYAFDANGVMVSQSRFDADLREIGLLPPDPSVRAIFNLEIRDPGGNLLAGYVPKTGRTKQPLTRMAAAAVVGRRGSDVEGYRDYRGVDVIGAWHWMDDYGFGVATEVDVAEAFIALYRVRWLFRGLFALLAVAALATVGSTVAISRLGHRADQAMRRARRLGQYTLEEKIGSGGMGDVYRASHALLRRPTAIKLLSSGRGGTQELARFEQEVQATSQLTHPNTVAIYDYGRTPDGLFYYAMEYLPGFQLDQLAPAGEPLPPARVAYLLQQVCGSLAEAHQANLVHRDIKPANLIVCRRGGIADFVKVLDFGIVKPVGGDAQGVTEAGTFAGTPEYASPEQIRGVPVDGRSDIYALGALAYFALTGAPPFACGSPLEICSAHLSESPRPFAEVGVSGVPAGLEAIVMRCLAKSPDDRCASMRELRQALRAVEFDSPWTQREAHAWWRERAPQEPGSETEPVARGAMTGRQVRIIAAERAD